MNVSDEELEMLRELAEAEGLTASDYLRSTIRRDHREKLRGKAPKKPKR